jgi:hypothetical protein
MLLSWLYLNFMLSLLTGRLFSLFSKSPTMSSRFYSICSFLMRLLAFFIALKKFWSDSVERLLLSSADYFFLNMFENIPPFLNSNNLAYSYSRIL